MTATRIPAVLCRMAGLSIALPSEGVRAIVRLQQPTALPGAPAALPAVFAHRGQVLPIVDVGALLGMPPSNPGAGTSAVVCEAREGTFAIAVDAIIEVGEFAEVRTGDFSLARSMIDPTPSESTPGTPEAAAVALLDLEAVYGAGRQAVREGRASR